jgi:phage gp29-like protein
MNLKDILTFAFLRQRPVPLTEDGIPVGRRTISTVLGEPNAIAHTLTVERVLSCLRAAEAGDTQDLFRIYRDIILGHAHTQNLFNQRKLSVLTKALNIVPEDAKKPEDLRAAEAAQMLTKVPGWIRIGLNHLLNGHLYPLAVLEQPYGIAASNALGVRFAPAEFAPVPYHLLDWQDECLQIWEADEKFGQRTGGRLVPEAGRYVIHRGHLLTHIPDNWGGPLRAALFWYQFAIQGRDWWVRFLDRMGIPLMVGKYDTSDTGAKAILTRAFQAATKLFGLVVSKETEIDLHEVNTSGHGDAFERLQAFANGELSKLILGQTMTVTAQAGGLGGAQASVQENVQGSIEAWDLAALAETVNNDVIGFFLRANGFVGRAVLQVATDTTAELAARTKYLETAVKAGLTPTDEAIEVLNKASGLPMQRAAAPMPAIPALAAFARGESAADRLRRQGLPTNDQLDSIAVKAAPDLAKAFRGRYASVRDLIAASTSAADLEHRLHVHFADTPAAYLAPILEDALTAYMATGAAAAAKP